MELKITKDTDKFREAAIMFNETGCYCAAPVGTTEFEVYWDTEEDRCLNGFEAKDGDWISGYFYFYLNYSRILLVNKKTVTKKGELVEVEERMESFPRFWDSDRAYFDAIEKAETEGQHLVVLKTRGRGYSFKGGSMLVRNFALIPKSKSYAVAAEMEFLTKDGILTKAWDILAFINQNTAWSKRMDKYNTKIHKKASFIDAHDGIEKGFNSEIMGITLKNDPQKLRGKRGKLILFEEAGKFTGLLEAWQIARPSVEQGTFATGLLICFGTGGSSGANFESLQELFYSPLAYNVLPFENIWDPGAIKSCGFFVPEYVNMEGINEDGEPFMDKNGNSNIILATKEAKKARQLVLKNANDKNAIDRYIAEHPFCLQKDTWVSVKGVKKNIELQKIKDVKNKFNNGIQDIYKLTTDNNRELLCTNTHHIYNGEKYKPLSEYNIGDTIKLLPFYFSDNYQNIKIEYNIARLSFNLKITKDWGKFLGMFMGDGSFYSRRYINELEFALDKRDIKSIKWVSNFIKKNNFGNPKLSDIGEMTRVRTSNVKLLDLFKQLGLIYRTSEKGGWKRKVHVPEYIIKSPKKVVAAFLSGLFDTDGSITKTQGNISLYTKYENFSRDIIMLLTGFGIYPKYSKQEKTNPEGRKYIGRKISIKKVHNLIFLEHIKFISNRKQNILKNILPQRKLDEDWGFDTVKSIEYYGKDQVYNIQTDIKYYSANGIHTHNSPMESMLQIAGNIFPKKLLIDQLVYLQTNRSAKNAGQCGRLEWTGGGILKWITGEGLKAIEKFPLDRSDNTTGAIQIWEHPFKDQDGKIPSGLYISGTDPYDHDKSETGSLGSTLIYKRFQSFEENYDIIVAEYTARPKTANEYYENVRKLLTYYNAINLYENERMGMYQYFVTKQCTHLLADQPEIIHEIIKDSHVRRPKGIHMVTRIKDYGESKLTDWLKEEYSPGLCNIKKIYSIPLVKELISYYDEGNFDRVIAMFLLMIFNKELHKNHVKIKNTETMKEGFFPNVIYVNKTNFIV